MLREALERYQETMERGFDQLDAKLREIHGLLQGINGGLADRVAREVAKIQDERLR